MRSQAGPETEASWTAIRAGKRASYSPWTMRTGMEQVGRVSMVRQTSGMRSTKRRGRSKWLSCGLNVLQQRREAGGDLHVPLRPIMAAGCDVEFVGKMTSLKAGGKSIVLFEQRLLFAGGEVEIGGLLGIRGLDQDEGIALSAGLASGRSEDG